MLSKFISRNKNQRLILIFAGWGMDWHPFRNLEMPGYDIMVMWDYRDLTYNWSVVSRYSEICLVAWSMGVFAASLTVHEILPRITKRVAVNGTLFPIDSRKGIPDAIYHGTLNALSPRTLRKFYRRMCTSAEEFARFEAVMPRRPVAELADELREIETHTIFHVPQVEEWDLAIVSRHDAIFPTENQINAWRGNTPVRFLESGHLPDFGALLTRVIIDKDRVRKRFVESAATYRGSALVQHDIADALMRRYDCIHGPAPIEGLIVEVGCGDGTLTRHIHPRLTKELSVLNLWDISPVAAESVPEGARFECCDAEIRMRRVATGSLSHIFSASTIQWFNSPASFLRECSRALMPGGLLVLSTFAAGNLSEIADVAGTALQLPPSAGWRTMLPPQMEVLICEETTSTLTFDNPRDVLNHLRDTGVNAVSFGSNPMLVARRLLTGYPRDAAGKCPLTYRPVYIIARRIDDNPAARR